MLKSIGLFSVLIMGVATAAYLPAGDPCPSGTCGGAKATSAGEATACAAGECSGEKATACTAGEKSCAGCPSMELTSQGEAKSCCAGEKATSAGTKSCEGCPSMKLTSQGEAKSCCSGEKATSAGAKSCEGCPSTKLTSQGEAKSCCAGEKATTCAAGENCTACSAGGEKCCGKCSSTKLTSAGEGKACGCADGKCTGACSKDTTVATSAKPADGATCTSSCGADCKDCPITAAMKHLPQMAYQVGTEKVCCPKAAGELAKKSDVKIQFVVADKTYDQEGKAKLALVEATEQFVAAFAKPKVCEKSGNITVAGQKACCAGTAAQMATVAKEAMEKVTLTYLVGEKSCHCPKEAEKLAKESGDVTLFVVGEDKTACNVSARLNLARAKYKAAVVAMLQTTSETKDTSTDS